MMTLNPYGPTFFKDYFIDKENRRKALLDKQTASSADQPKKKNLSPLLTYNQYIIHFPVPVKVTRLPNVHKLTTSHHTRTNSSPKPKYKVELLKNMSVKSKFIYKKINKRYNRRHLSTYLARRLSINREYNYRIKRTLLITSVYNDSVNTTKYGTLDQFNVGLMMYLAFHTC